MAVMPVRPEHMVGLRFAIPPRVVEIWNKLITDAWDGHEAVVLQKDALKALAGVPSNGKFRWLNIEDLYREAGWEVKYDKPGYNESYDAYFVFKKKK